MTSYFGSTPFYPYTNQYICIRTGKELRWYGVIANESVSWLVIKGVSHFDNFFCFDQPSRASARLEVGQQGIVLTLHYHGDKVNYTKEKVLTTIDFIKLGG